MSNKDIIEEVFSSRSTFNEIVNHGRDQNDCNNAFKERLEELLPEFTIIHTAIIDLDRNYRVINAAYALIKDDEDRVYKAGIFTVINDSFVKVEEVKN